MTMAAEIKSRMGPPSAPSEVGGGISVGGGGTRPVEQSKSGCC